MASMKHDLTRLETSKKKRKRHDSSDDSEVNTSEEERVLESSDDSHEEDNPTPSLDTRIKSLIASKEQSSAAADAKGWTIRYPGRGVSDPKKNSCKKLN